MLHRVPRNRLFIQWPHRRHALRHEHSASAVLAPCHVVCENYGRGIAHVAPLTFFYRSRGPRQCSPESEKANRWHQAVCLGTCQRLGISSTGRGSTYRLRFLMCSGMQAFYSSMLPTLARGSLLSGKLHQAKIQEAAIVPELRRMPYLLSKEAMCTHRP